MDAMKWVPRKSNYISGEDIAGLGDITLTIEWAGHVTDTVTEAGRQVKREDLPVIRFVGRSKGMICNSTNRTRIMRMHGREIDNWAGKEITLYTVKRVMREQDEESGDWVKVVKDVIRVREGKRRSSNPEDV
jgi:hypothetical protein